MTFTQEQVEAAIKATWVRFFRSLILSGAVGGAALYYLSWSSKDDMTLPAGLFFGFFVGFACAGTILPRGFRKLLYRQRWKA
ncbi:MAG: hypothetical protein H7249_00890 [Chitinophagaceae bacterium]|nr:hypothetical protein [Oligoflexus sp.]